MMRKNAPAKLYLMSGFLLIFSGAIGETFAFIPIGICFIILGFMKK